MAAVWCTHVACLGFGFWKEERSMVIWLDGSNSASFHCSGLVSLADTSGTALKIFQRSLKIPWMLLLRKRPREKLRIKQRPQLHLHLRLRLRPPRHNRPRTLPSLIPHRPFHWPMTRIRSVTRRTRPMRIS